MSAAAWGLVASVVLCFAASGLGGLFTAASVRDWYPALAKPSFTPPSAVFGPVWTVLYLMMAVAAWLVWRGRGLSRAALPLGLFAVQLALNVAWSALFFGLRRPGAGFVDIVALWAAIVATTVAFWPVSRAAGALMLPYLAWVSFAGVLNWSIWRMNA